MDNNSTIVKFIGLFVVVIMALSMLAAGLLYTKNDSNNNTDSLPEPTATAFDYTLSFETQAIKELGSARFVAYTFNIDKTVIDSAVMKVEGVSKVVSQFRKESFDSNEWIYFAEITLKKSADIDSVLESVSKITEFDSNKGFTAMKYVTISVPSSVMLHNADLNIDRNFSFPTTTLSTLASTYTMPADKILVSGSIKVQGSAILFLELIEEKNITQEEAWQSYLDSQELDYTVSDENSPKEPISVTIE